MPDLSPSDVGITIIVLLWIVKELITLIKNKKDNSKPILCNAESKEITKIKMKQLYEQHEKMIGTLSAINTNLALMNETIQSTNKKSARMEKDVTFIRDSIT